MYNIVSSSYHNFVVLIKEEEKSSQEYTIMEEDNYRAIDEQIRALQLRKARMVRENTGNRPKDVGLVWLPDTRQHLRVGFATASNEKAWLECCKCSVIHRTLRSDEQRSGKYYETKTVCPNCGFVNTRPEIRDH